MGAYHTIDLELNRKFTLLKEYWDLIALERVGEYSTTKVAIKLLLQVLQLFLEYRLSNHPYIVSFLQILLENPLSQPICDRARKILDYEICSDIFQ